MPSCEQYKVYVEGEYWGNVLDESIVLNNLNTETEYEESALRDIIFKGQDRVCFNTALYYISSYVKTEKELRDYLKKKGFPPFAVDYALTKLLEYGYINDDTYAKNYVAAKSMSKGKKALAFELRQKGVAEDIIQKNLAEMDCQAEVIESLARKFSRTKAHDPKLREKLIRHLAGKGFAMGEIMPVVREILEEIGKGGTNEDWS